MRIDALSLDFFRNYVHLDAAFDPNINVIYGDNAQGKTNLLEAVAYLSGVSHRARYDKELIQFGVDHAFLKSSVFSRERTFLLEAELHRGARRVLRSNGVKLKNRWRWVKWYGKTYKAYFGPTGAAYAGTRQYGALVPAVKRISGAYYGFDRVGAMLKGTYVVNNRFYVFSSQTGKLNTSISAKLRAACKYGESTATLKRILKNIGLKPLKVQRLEGCYGDGYDIVYTYKNFQISAHENTDGSEIFFGLIAK